jgi:hypothetical protein
MEVLYKVGLGSRYLDPWRPDYFSEDKDVQARDPTPQLALVPT